MTPNTGAIALAFIIGIGVGEFAILAGLILRIGSLMAMIEVTPPAPSKPRCPYCDHPLRPVVVADIDMPPPAGARWYCSEGDWAYQPCKKSVVYFADLPAAKPAPIEEV